MKKFISHVAITVATVATVLLPVSHSVLALDNNLVITDANFTDSGTMSAAEINSFFASQGSWMANYTIPEYIDVPYPTTSGLQTVSARQYYDATGAAFYGKTVAQLIYDESREHSINPRVIIATLQKESSAVTRSSPSSSTTQAWPMFYYYTEAMATCFNTGTSCDDATYRQRAIDYGGIGQQIAYSTAWFRSKYGLYVSSYSSPITIDGQTIVCGSIGTRVLYIYTPHVQTSFYNIWSGWWGDPAPTATTSIYRFWSSRYGKHFYTGNATEKDYLINNDPAWSYEGVIGIAYTSISGRGTPVYRFWSPVFSNAHFYTTNEAEKNNLIANDPNWTYEGVVFNAGGSHSVYRFWSSTYRSHFFTTNEAEKNNLIANDPNWTYEGVAYNID